MMYLHQYLAAQGVSLKVIARALGHTTTKMSGRFARPSEEAIKRAAEALDRANQSLAALSGGRGGRLTVSRSGLRSRKPSPSRPR